MGQKYDPVSTHGEARAIWNKLVPNDTRPTWVPTGFTLTDKETYFADFTQTGNIAVANPTISYGIGAEFSVTITGNGSTFTVGTNFELQYTELTNDVLVSGKAYIFRGYWDGTKIRCSIAGAEAATGQPLTIVGLTGVTLVANDYTNVDTGQTEEIKGVTSIKDSTGKEMLSRGLEPNSYLTDGNERIRIYNDGDELTNITIYFII